MLLIGSACTVAASNYDKIRVIASTACRKIYIPSAYKLRGYNSLIPLYAQQHRHNTVARESQSVAYTYIDWLGGAITMPKAVTERTPISLAHSQQSASQARIISFRTNSG